MQNFTRKIQVEGSMKSMWIGTGWKMNHLLKDALEYVEILDSFVSSAELSSNIFICVPFTVLYQVCKKLIDSKILVGSQNSHWLDTGAATGEISPLMINDTGAKLVEIGHSERRENFGENDYTVNLKVKSVLAHNLIPLICIGETYQEKEYNVSIERLVWQVKIALHELSNDQIHKVILAYEPVWAIGEKGAPASSDYVEYVHSQIKCAVSDLLGKDDETNIPILYGGSVNKMNAISFISQPSVDGLFIGRSAWKAEGLISIIQDVETYLQEQGKNK